MWWHLVQSIIITGIGKLPLLHVPKPCWLCYISRILWVRNKNSEWCRKTALQGAKHLTRHCLHVQYFGTSMNTCGKKYTKKDIYRFHCTYKLLKKTSRTPCTPSLSKHMMAAWRLSMLQWIFWIRLLFFIQY